MLKPIFAAACRTLLAAALCASPALAGEFPDEWFFTENNGERPRDHTQFEGANAPALSLTDWVNGELTPEDMEGHIVVIDFWATWCGPCIASIPHNNEIMEAYAKEGVRFVAVCASGDPGQMPGILEQNGAEYPAAFVDGDQVNTDWPIAFFPTYAVVDATGTVRAIGLKPDAVEQVVDALLDEQAENAGRVRIPRNWLEGDANSRDRLRNLEENADSPPALEVDQWVNAGDTGLAPEDLEGKVVLLSFGATWAAPWLNTIEELNTLHETYSDQGLVVIGICATLEGFALANVAEEYNLAFPACVDVDNRTNRAYGPNGFPDYYLLDKQGHLRIADLNHANLEEAIQALLAEEVEADETDNTDEAGDEEENDHVAGRLSADDDTNADESE
ncbi:MAG: TlpA disulfide reductase family protein [Planctomycetota bacterium]